MLEMIYWAVICFGLPAGLLVYSIRKRCAGSLCLDMPWSKKREKERCFMRKSLFAVMFVVCLCLLGGCSKGSVTAELADCFDEETVEEEAKAAITLGESGNYEEFIKLFDDAVAESMTQEVYEDQYLSVVKEKGAFESFSDGILVGQTDPDTGAHYAGVVLVANYEDGKIQYTIGYNEDMKLIQFLIK